MRWFADNLNDIALVAAGAAVVIWIALMALGCSDRERAALPMVMADDSLCVEAVQAHKDAFVAQFGPTEYYGRVMVTDDVAQLQAWLAPYGIPGCASGAVLPDHPEVAKRTIVVLGFNGAGMEHVAEGVQHELGHIQQPGRPHDAWFAAIDQHARATSAALTTSRAAP